MEQPSVSPELLVPDGIVHGRHGSPEIGQVLEEPRQAPELVLGPGVEWVVVTLGAVQPPAQEHPGLLGHDVLGEANFVGSPEMAGGAVIPLAGHALPGHLVEGLVAGNGVPDPLPVELDLIPAPLLMGDPEQIGQAEGPVVDVLRRVEEGGDQAVPLARIRTFQKFPDPPGRGQGSRQIQADPPQELLVAGEFRGQDAEAAQLSPDLLVDEVPRGLLRKLLEDPAHHRQ